MGKAATDLPDPTQATALGATPSADDLLSQLAGDEIDRLLAEADVEPPAAEPELVAPAPLPSAATPDTPPPGGKAPGETSPASPPAIDTQLDDLFKQLSDHDDQQSPQSPEPADAAPPPAAPAPAPAATEPVEPAGETVARAPDFAVPEEDPTTVEEREALDSSADEADDPGLPLSADEEALPVYLLPLEWLNAPLRSCPEWVRAAIGKAALITLFNALAILIYVLLFRRPPHQ